MRRTLEIGEARNGLYFIYPKCVKNNNHSTVKFDVPAHSTSSVPTYILNYCIATQYNHLSNIDIISRKNKCLHKSTMQNSIPIDMNQSYVSAYCMSLLVI